MYLMGKRLWCLHITTWQPIKEKGEKGEGQICPACQTAFVTILLSSPASSLLF